MDLSNFSILKIEKERSALDPVIQDGQEAKKKKDQLEIITSVLVEFASMKRKVELFPKNEQYERRYKFLKLFPYLSLYYSFCSTAYNPQGLGNLLSHIDRFPNVEKEFLRQCKEAEDGISLKWRADMDKMLAGFEKDKDKVEQVVSVQKKEASNRELSEKEMSRIEI